MPFTVLTDSVTAAVDIHVPIRTVGGDATAESPAGEEDGWPKRLRHGVAIALDTHGESDI